MGEDKMSFGVAVCPCTREGLSELRDFRLRTCSPHLRFRFNAQSARVGSFGNFEITSSQLSLTSGCGNGWQHEISDPSRPDATSVLPTPLSSSIFRLYHGGGYVTSSVSFQIRWLLRSLAPSLSPLISTRPREISPTPFFFSSFSHSFSNSLSPSPFPHFGLT